MISWISAMGLTVIMLLSSLSVTSRPHHLSVMGATSVVAYLRAAIPGWERLHPHDSVTLSGGGSVAGLVEVSRGRVDVGIADIPARSQWTGGVRLEQKVLGRLPVLFITNDNVPIRTLTETQLRSILSGRITNWRAVGGPNEPIIVVARPLSSGALFVVQREILGHLSLSAVAIIQLSNGAVTAVVRETPGAIGFIESGIIPYSVRTLGIGTNQYRVGGQAKNWPYYATPTLYYRAPASPVVKSLVCYLAQSEERARFGILAGAS